MKLSEFSKTKKTNLAHLIFRCSSSFLFYFNFLMEIQAESDDTIFSIFLRIKIWHISILFWNSWWKNTRFVFFTKFSLMHWEMRQYLSIEHCPFGNMNAFFLMMVIYILKIPPTSNFQIVSSNVHYIIKNYPPPVLIFLWGSRGCLAIIF